MTIMINHLAVKRGGHTVVKDLTARAQPGRVTVLLGPNAAGKSTLMLTLIGAIRATRGTVELNGHPVASMRPRQLARIAAYVPQRPSVGGGFTVQEVVELGRYAVGMDDHRVADAICQLALTDLAARPFHKLSVGQQQRVTLARAIAQLDGGGCLLLDEPTSAMDLRHVEQAMHVIRATSRRGATVLVAMHDLGAIQRLADDVWILKEGRLAASGSSVEVLDPDLLESVFEVPFTVLRDSSGERFVVPSHLRASNV